MTRLSPLFLSASAKHFSLALFMTTTPDNSAVRSDNRLAQELISRRTAGGRRINKSSVATAPVSLTIVTVVHNGGERLAASINSVTSLQREDVAYIVVDAGSTDGTVDILRSIDDKIEYWISEPDHGIYHAMNKAIKLAEPGTFILFIGAGDKILQLPDSETIAAAKNSDAQVLFGDVLIGEWLFRSSFSAKLKYRNTLHHQGLFVRKGYPEEPWFDESFKVFSDWDFNLSLFKRGVTTKRLDYTVAYAEPDGISAKLNLPEIARLIRKRCGSLHALAAISYHGGLYIIRKYASLSRSPRK